MRQCAFCHQQGSWATRVPRSRADWDKIFTLMGRMGGIISAGLRAELPDAFNAAYADESYLHALTPVHLSRRRRSGGDGGDHRMGSRRAGVDAARPGGPSRRHDLSRSTPTRTSSTGSTRAPVSAGRTTSRAATRRSAACSAAPVCCWRRTATRTSRRTACRSLPTAPSGSRSASATSSAASIRKTEQWQIIEQEDGPLSAHAALRSPGPHLVHAGGQQPRRHVSTRTPASAARCACRRATGNRSWRCA